MRAYLHSLSSPDVLDLEHDYPANHEDFEVLVEAAIGPDERGKGTGSEVFSFLVCNLRHVEGRMQDRGFFFGRPYLVVEYFDYRLIRGQIERLCREIGGDSWLDVAVRLSRFAFWEFEGYPLESVMFTSRHGVAGGLPPPSGQP